MIGRGPDGAVLVRRLHEPIPPAVERGIEALAAASGRPHVTCLRDLAIDPAGSLVVVTGLVTGPSIRELLAARTWQLGHVVTLLVPLLRTLADLHDAGITVGRLDLDSVRVDASGSPIIVDWSEAVATPPLPPRLRERDAHYAADTAAVAHLVAAVIDVLPEPEGQQLREVMAGALDDVDGSSLASTSLIDKLFSVADPLPLGDSRAPGPQATPSSVLAAPAVTAPVEGSATSPESAIAPPLGGTIARVSATLGVPVSLVTAIDAAVLGVGTRLTGVRHRAAQLPRRRLLLIAAAAAVGIAMTISTVLNGGGSGDAVTLLEDSRGIDPSTGEAEVETSAPWSPMGDSTADPAAPATPSVLDLPDPQDSEWSSVVSALVVEWERCARASERLCDTALHRESAVADLRLHGHDGEPLARLGALVEAGPEVLVTERMGAAIILDITAAETTAASLLLMRSEAGWRVRDVLD